MWMQHINKKTLGSLLLAGSMLSAPTRRIDLDYIGQFNFKVEIEGVTQGVFRCVEGLDSETEVVEYEDRVDKIMRKRPGRTKYGNITLKRGYVNDLFYYQWRNEIMNEDRVTKKNGSIILYDDTNREVARYNFFEAWPSKWKGFSLDGKGNDINVEEIELAVEKLERG